MLENMSGCVGNAMHEERQRQARAQRMNAGAAPILSWWRVVLRMCRGTASTALMRLAARVEPSRPTAAADPVAATPAP